MTSSRNHAGRPRVILLTGFEPFGEVAVNPSGQVARALDGASIGGARVIGMELPCRFGVALDLLGEALRRHRPEVVVVLGVAVDRDAITPERIAVNLDDARLADNAGLRPVGSVIVPNGPAAYWSRLPVKAMVRDMVRAGIPASLSMTAGTYVCNHVFYGLMHTVRRRSGVRAGFIHVPGLTNGVAPDRPGWTQGEIERGVRIALGTVMRRRRDLEVGAGETS